MSIETELEAIRTGAAIAPLTDRAFLRITGSDATRWLNGMVTNSIKDLQPGQGNYNFLLNAQGRIQADCTIYRDGDEYILEADSSQLTAIEQIFDKFIIMDDVEVVQVLYIHSLVVAKSGLLLTGPNAPSLLTECLNDQWEKPLHPHALGMMSRASANGERLLVFAHPASKTPTYELWFSEPQERTLVAEGFLRSNTIEISPEALEAHRILSGTPKFGVDIRDKDLPQETNQTHALHFNKGCYLGQEIVERIRSRGQVHRTFTKFTLEGDLPTTFPTPLEASAKPAGEITSAVRIGDKIHALGYIRREALELKQTVTYANGTAIPSNS